MTRLPEAALAPGPADPVSLIGSDFPPDRHRVLRQWWCANQEAERVGQQHQLPVAHHRPFGAQLVIGPTQLVFDWLEGVS